MADGKWYGKSLPSPVDPGETICFKITVPNALQYKAALLGQLNFLGLWFAWHHQNDGIIPTDNEIAAQLWVDAVAGSSFEECMDFCAQMIACIEDDSDVQEAIVDMLGENEEFRDFLSDYIDEHPTGSIYEKNRPIPETTKLTTNGGCNLDILWSQCRGIVETANTFVLDFIEKWETYTNKGEVVSDMVNAVPLLAELAQASGVTGILEYANDLVDSIGENYTADYDETYEITLACELFCAAQLHEDCVLTIADVFEILHARVGDSLSFGNVTELIVSLTDQDITGINVADLYLFFFFAAMQIGNILLPDQFGFETYIKIITVINEPNDDWTTLCDECTSEPRWTLYVLEDFNAQELTYLGIDPEDSSWDLWSVVCADYGGAKFEGYTYGYNVRMSPSTGDYGSNPFSIEDLSGSVRTFSYVAPGAFVSADHFSGTSGPDYWAAEGFRSTAGTCTFRIKPR